MKKDKKKQEPSDKDWVAYIPDNEWVVFMNLCDKLEKSQTEFQKAIYGAKKVEIYE